VPRTSWSYRFADPDVRERTAILEATIRAGGCEGEPVHAQTFGRDQDAAMPPLLSAGTYGLELVARDAACAVIGQVCELIVAGERAEVVLTIAREDSGESCASGEVCDGGRCEAGDCGCVDEAGACRSGTELTACGAGGGRCEVCCGGGADTCEAGACVPLSSRRVEHVSAGKSHTCALLTRGEVFCWGANDDGQLAAGDLAASLTPVQIGAAPDWTTLHGAFSTVCGARRASGARCWGWNSAAQVGTGSQDPDRIAAEEPLVVTEPLVETYADRFHSCGRAESGAVHCWGSNGLFALWQDAVGIYPPTAVLAPTGAPASWDAVRVGLGRTCALAGGELWCAGYGSHGRIGVPASALTAERNINLIETPARIAPEITWADVSLGVAHSCGIDDAGRLYCWGCGAKCDPSMHNCDPMNVDVEADVRDCSFALGYLPASGWYVEAPADGLVDDGPFLAVSASQHTCAILDDGGGDGAGRLVCFGPNEHGQLGDGTSTARGFDRSAAVMDGARFRAVSAGLRHACAIRDTGALYCWGLGEDRALGTTDLAPEEPLEHEALMRQDALSPRRACLD